MCAYLPTHLILIDNKEAERTKICRFTNAIIILYILKQGSFSDEVFDEFMGRILFSLVN